MKRLFILIFLLSLDVVAVPPTITNMVILRWSFDPSQLTNCSFIVSGTTNLSLSISNWPTLAVVDKTNAAIFPIQAGTWFFTCQASNYWGVSPFSNTATTPATPSSLNSLELGPLR